MRAWIDQDLCTGDGLCTDHGPHVFVLLGDGLPYVRDASGAASTMGSGPGGRVHVVPVPARRDDDVIAAASDGPGECIFVEPGDDPDVRPDPAADDHDIEPAVAGCVRRGFVRP